MACKSKFLILVLIWALIACNRQFEESEILGTYVANHGKAEDIIVVNKNGTYTHTYKTSEKVFKEEGKWEFEYFQNEPLISFYNFSHRWRETSFVPNNRPKVWPAHLERSFFGEIGLPLDDDLGYCFEKVR